MMLSRRNIELNNRYEVFLSVLETYLERRINWYKQNETGYGKGMVSAYEDILSLIKDQSEKTA
jgi:hypothetical protein